MSEKICVYGLWHLGSVTAACLATAGFEVIGLDSDPARVEAFAQGEPPIAEPDLAELIREGMSSRRLSFSNDLADALREAGVLWVTFDTPVDDEDRADVEWVRQQVEIALPHVMPGALVLVSSQVPVGFTAELATRWPKIEFAVSPENLRLGQAIAVFRAPERVIVGLPESSPKREQIAWLFAPFCERIEWMSRESAEMTKHALNSFLAVSVVFANELARLCERAGADARDVERGLRSDPRIGPRAYVSPGPPLAGGTLARDIRFLGTLARRRGVDAPLIDAVLASNAIHAQWAEQRVLELVGTIEAPRVAVLGLTYKPGTDTLRRSSALEIAQKLVDRGVSVSAFDPAISVLPSELKAIELAHNVDAALAGADVALIATPWPQFRDLSAERFKQVMRRPQVVDPTSALESLASDPDLIYVRVGVAARK